MLFLYVNCMILNEKGIIGCGYNTYCNANKSCDEILDESTQCTKRLGFKISEKEITLPIMYWIPKMQNISISAHFYHCI